MLSITSHNHLVKSYHIIIILSNHITSSSCQITSHNHHLVKSYHIIILSNHITSSSCQITSHNHHLVKSHHIIILSNHHHHHLVKSLTLTQLWWDHLHGCWGGGRMWQSEWTPKM